MPAPLEALARAILRDIGSSTGRTHELVGPTAGGESRSTFIVEAADSRFILKLEPAVRAQAHRRAARAGDYLRALGYPIAEVVATGVRSAHTYTLRTLSPGEPLQPNDGRFAEQLLRLNDLQADGAGRAGLPPDKGPASVIDPVLIGGTGVSEIETMRRHSQESVELLTELQALAAGQSLPPPADIVHYDFNPANILVDRDGIGGVVDWEGVRAGDRAFDLATLLFYAYESPEMRESLWHRLRVLRSVNVIGVYLAHIILRQVEWSLRLHAPEVGRRYLDQAHAVLRDLALVRDGAALG